MDASLIRFSNKGDPLSPKTDEARWFFQRASIWVQGLDLNQGPSGYEPDELPDCSTLQHLQRTEDAKQSTCVQAFYSRVHHF